MPSPVPDIMLQSIYDITPDMLHDLGITLLLMDLDNTLAEYGNVLPSDKLKSWTRSLERAGIVPLVYSNNRGERPQIFSKALEVDFIGHAGKPKIGRFPEVLDKYSKTKSETAMVGDQIFTDIMFGKRAGITTIAVHPMSLENPFRFIRYGLEYPYRHTYKKNQRKKN